jgi:hypothetical protein
MITKYENFFSEDVSNEIDKLINSILSNKSPNMPVYSASISSWDDDLISSSTPVLRYFISEKDENLMRKIKKEIFTKTKYEVDQVLLHFWPKLSYINWHNDSMYKGALTIYLNKNWNPNWGGYLMYQDQDTSEIKGIIPKYNLGVLQENGVKHCVSTINMDADIRISMQAFLTKEKKLI